MTSAIPTPAATADRAERLDAKPIPIQVQARQILALIRSLRPSSSADDLRDMAAQARSLVLILRTRGHSDLARKMAIQAGNCVREADLRAA